jgi:hypothetical protein
MKKRGGQHERTQASDREEGTRLHIARAHGGTRHSGSAGEYCRASRFAVLRKAKLGTVKIQVDALSAAFDAFHLDNDRFPITSEGLRALVDRPEGLPTWDGPYIKKRDSLVDPWVIRTPIAIQVATAISKFSRWVLISAKVGRGCTRHW